MPSARTRAGERGAVPVASTAEVLGSTDLLLCLRTRADELGLHWRPIGELNLIRAYDVTAGLRENAQRIRSLLPNAIRRCIGLPADGAPGDNTPVGGHDIEMDAATGSWFADFALSDMLE